MVFVGVKDEADRKNLIAFLKVGGQVGDEAWWRGRICET